MNSSEKAADLINGVVGTAVSHVWKGYGSTIYLELGSLTPSTLTRRDGSSGNPTGEITIGIHWGWRVENRDRIVCGSCSENEEVLSWLTKLMHQTVLGISFVGRLPELQVSFSGDLYLISFMTAEGDPEWEIMDRRGSIPQEIACEAGQVRVKELRISGIQAASK